MIEEQKPAPATEVAPKPPVTETPVTEKTVAAKPLVEAPVIEISIPKVAAKTTTIEAKALPVRDKTNTQAEPISETVDDNAATAVSAVETIAKEIVAVPTSSEEVVIGKAETPAAKPAPVAKPTTATMPVAPATSTKTASAKPVGRSSNAVSYTHLTLPTSDLV